RLKSLSVTIKPAVKPLSGTSHWVSENRSPAGAVQILRWSSTKRPTSPSPFPSDVFEAAFTSDGASAREDDVDLSGPVLDAVGSAPRSCAEDILAIPTPNSSAAPRIPTCFRVLIRA